MIELSFLNEQRKGCRRPGAHGDPNRITELAHLSHEAFRNVAAKHWMGRYLGASRIVHPLQIYRIAKRRGVVHQTSMGSEEILARLHTQTSIETDMIEHVHESLPHWPGERSGLFRRLGCSVHVTTGNQLPPGFQEGVHR